MEFCTNTGDTNITHYYDAKGNEVFRCRCGSTHTGDYACNEWLQHECLHESDLLVIGNGVAMCGDCGQTWELDFETCKETVKQG